MSHKLESLLLIITIQYTLSNNKPLFLLLLDAKSASLPVGWERDGPHQRGVEQEGPNSSDLKKNYNNEQLSAPQASGLGTNAMDEAVAAIG